MGTTGNVVVVVTVDVVVAAVLAVEVELLVVDWVVDVAAGPDKHSLRSISGT